MAYLGRAEHQLVAEKLEVVGHFLLHLVAEGQGACGAEAAAALLHELNHGILDHLGVHGDGGELLSLAKSVEHGIGHISHAALHRQESGRDAAGLHLSHEEAAHVGADLEAGVVEGGEAFYAVVGATVDHANDLRGVDLDGGGAYAVACGVDGYLAAVGGILGYIVVVEAIELARKLRIELKDHMLGQKGVGGHIAHTHTEHNLAIVGHVGHLDDGPVDLAVGIVAHLLCELAQMEVKVVAVVGVDALAQVGGVLIGSALAYGIGTGQRAVGPIVG